MIPKLIIQFHNRKLNKGNKCNNVNKELPDDYYDFSKRVAYVLFYLYDHPYKSLKLNDIDNQYNRYLYNDANALNTLHLVKINRNPADNYYIDLTTKGFNFVKYELSNQSIIQTIFSKFSYKILSKLYRKMPAINTLVFTIGFGLLFTVSPSLTYIFPMIMWLWALMIVVDVCCGLNTNKYRYTYIDLMTFFKENNQNNSSVRIATTRAINMNKDYDAQIDEEDYEMDYQNDDSSPL